MTTHEAFVLGWVWGTLEGAMDDYDPTGYLFEAACAHPLLGLGQIMSDATRSGVINDVTNAKLARALNEVTADILSEDAEAVAPTPLQGSWQLGYFRGKSGKPWDWFDIRAERERAGLTQAELAERIGTAQSNVARWEADNVTPRAETLRKIREALDKGLESDGASE